MPTKAAVRVGERFAKMANAPAETIGGMPASKIETCTASPCRPTILHSNNAVAGAAISFMKRPIDSCEIISLSKLRVSWNPTAIITNGTNVEDNSFKILTATGGYGSVLIAKARINAINGGNEMIFFATLFMVGVLFPVP